MKKFIGQFPEFTIVTDITYQQGTADVTSEVQRLIAARPDVVMHASYDAEAILFARTYKQYGFKPQGIMAIGAAFGSNAFRSALGPDADYVLVRDHWSATSLRRSPSSASSASSTRSAMARTSMGRRHAPSRR